MDERSRKREDDWFLQNEKKLLEEARKAREKREAERRARETEEQRGKLKQLHWMKCPKCGHDLKTEALEGVEIDRCTFCEGFFVDAGRARGAVPQEGRGPAPELHASAAGDLRPGAPVPEAGDACLT